MGLSDITADAVRAAIAECDEAGREPFRDRYGFWAAREFELVYRGRRYDSKAIAGVAHRYVTRQVLTPGRFSGGALTVARRLRRLGFTVEQIKGDASGARLPLVLIAPYYGNPGSRGRFADTLAHEVAFTGPPRRACLSQVELDALLAVHPVGAARLWGARARHDAKMCPWP